MIASRPIQHAVRGMGRNALDLPVAALAGLAIVFVTIAVPGDFLSTIVNGTGLPSLIPAAAPPLGLTARICVAIGGALGAFGLVFLLLRLLDRTGFEKVSEPRPAEPDEDAPKLRRRDVHPDAPGRRPISAARDLGEPAPPEPPRSAPAPIWLAEPEPEPVAEAEPVVEPAAVIEPAPASSLGELMERLERGLARRETHSAAATAPQVFPEARDDRLQSAIDSLQRLAARQT
jgi:hypothetical protein